eukprot:4115340-Ditylum_brightwellii.AAC.2
MDESSSGTRDAALLLTSVAAIATKEVVQAMTQPYLPMYYWAYLLEAVETAHDVYAVTVP